MDWNQMEWNQMGWNQSLRSEAEQWRRGTDTMDVWFDSGSSWAGVAKARKDLAYPADLYLEGERERET